MKEHTKISSAYYCVVAQLVSIGTNIQTGPLIYF